jgi:hypothetical protein
MAGWTHSIGCGATIKVEVFQRFLDRVGYFSMNTFLLGIHVVSECEVEQDRYHGHNKIAASSGNAKHDTTGHAKKQCDLHDG